MFKTPSLRTTVGKKASIDSSSGAKMLSDENLRYLESYEETLMSHYMSLDCHTDEREVQSYYQQTEITESLRARLLDWVLHCTQVCEMEDRNIFFIVAETIDTFYRLQTTPQPKAEL